MRHTRLASPLALAVLLQLALETASPARAADLVLDKFAVETTAGRYTAPSIEIRGTDQSRADFEAIFNPNSTEPLVQRLARVSAREILLPELSVEQKVAGATQTTTYRDIRLTDVKQGVIGMGRAATASGSTMKEGAVVQTSQSGETTISGVDLPASVRVLVETVGPNDAPMTLYKSFAILDMKVSGGNQPAVEIARVSGTDFAARPGRTPISTLMQRLSAANDKSPDSKDLAVFSDVLELIEGMSVGSFEMAGLTFRDDPAKAASSGKPPASGKIARIFGAMPKEKPASFAIEGVEVGAEEASVRIGALKLDGFSLTPALNGIKAWLARPDALQAKPDIATMIPKLGTIRFEDISVTPKGKSGQSAGASDQVTVKGVELALSNQVGGVPTAARFAVDRLGGPLSLAKPDKGIKDLMAMGYSRLDVSSALEFAWAEAAQQVALKTLEFSGLDMFDFRAGGTIGNVPREAFSTDKALAQVAWLGATVHQLDLSLSNRGLFEKLLESEARKAGRTPDALRSEWSSMVMLGASALLGDSDGAKALARAVARFIAKPVRLTVNLKARNPAGLGLADVIALGDPQAAFGKIDVRANAE